MNEFELPGDCPSGLECPVHFRLDREIRDDRWMSYQAVTYVGKYCVLTGDNPKYVGNPLLLLDYILSHTAPDDLFSTSLYEVGHKGSLYDLTLTGKEIEPAQSVYGGDYTCAELNHSEMVRYAENCI